MISANLLATAAAVVSFYATSAKAANYATYPSVAHTASINGFADPIYAELPECAKSCVEEDTDSTPCPYWDPGCLCVMSTWGAAVAECFIENCQGSDVSSAASLATSICSSAGVPSPYWYLPASDSAALSSAAAATVTDDATSAAETSAAVTSGASSAAETSAAESAPETSAPAPTSAPETSAAAETSAPETAASSASESASESAASSDVAEVEAQENAAVFNVPGPALIALSAISFAAFYF